MKLIKLDDVFLKNRFGEFGKDVYNFNEKIGIEAKPYYKINQDEFNLFMLQRIGLMQEELSEITLASFKNDLIEVADGIVDLLYFAIGTAVLLDIPLKDIFRNVHNSNMSKVAGKSKRNIDNDAMKDDSFIKPNIDSIIKDDINNSKKVFKR